MLHGDGELGADISSRWLLPGQSVAPDDMEVADLEQLVLPGARSIVMGQGAGASRAYEFACARPDLVSVVVMLSGEAHAGECAHGPVVSVLTVHGTLDDVVPYTTAQVTFEAAQDLARCTDVSYVESPEIGVASNQIEALGCTERDEGRTRSAEHWRVLGWDHNPQLTTDWSRTVLTWSTDRS